MSAFVLIAALFGATDIARYLAGRAMRARSRAITERTLARGELVERMARDIDRERLLIDEHIFSKSHSEMALLDDELAQIGRDLSAANAVWRPAPQGLDRPAHEQLVAEIQELRPPVEAALALSRLNRDAEARAEMNRVTAHYTAIDKTLDELIHLNHLEAFQSLDRVSSMQQTFGLVFGFVALAGVIVTLAVGLVVIRLARRREEDQQRYAALLEQRNSDLDAFAGRVAHDLRGPLGTVSIAGALLHRRLDGDRDVQRVQRGTGRMVELIEDLLMFSRVGHEKVGGVSDPAQAAARVREELAPKLEAEEVELAIDVVPAQVVCNPGLFQELLGNLVDNAIKYRRTHEHPRVEIRGHPTHGLYELQIADNGLGMSPEDQAHLFEPFFRAPQSVERGGTGLGLSIVKRIVEAAGGEIAVDSSPGHGSVFTVRLPLDGVSATPAAPP
jgi:signal transduction histidine kinase